MPAGRAFGALAAVGQQLLLYGGYSWDDSGFDISTDVLFSIIGSDGVETRRVERPDSVNPEGTELTITVPHDASAE